MKVNLLGVKGTWREVADAARTTIGMEAGTGEPASSWKRRMLLAEHSPIRKIRISWIWRDLPWWVQTHFTRHKFGVEWFVSTSRTDRTGIDRSTLTQDAPVNVQGDANMQALINISRKRLCNQASKETREAWKAFLEAIKEHEPELYRCCVPDCIYRGWCYEYKSCGYHRTEAYGKRLTEYREGINAEGRDNVNNEGALSKYAYSNDVPPINMPIGCSLPNPKEDLAQYEVTGKYEAMGKAIGALVDVKNHQYGDAFHQTGKILAILYPKGVRPEQYNDMLAVVRVLDKLFRVANGKQGNEDPWQDISGYGLLGMEG